MNTAIAIEGVTKRFGGLVGGERPGSGSARGSLYGFIGPNGSGKTTTLRMIMHILLPDEGEIEVLGQRDTAGRPRPGQLPARGARAVQADERAAAAPLLRRAQGGQAARARPSRSTTGSSGWASRPGSTRRVDALSKGMAQKVQFIATVLNRPELLILDEPFTGLDPVNAEVLKDAVLDLKKAGTTVVFSTHDMAVAERLCDRIFMIFKGRKVLDGTLDEIQSIYGYDTIRVRTEAGAPLLSKTCPASSRSTITATCRSSAGAGTRKTCSMPSRLGRASSSSRSPGPPCTTSSSGSRRPQLR